jgi:predicted Zn-dependent protease
MTRKLGAAAALAGALLLADCAVNPATGKQQLVLISEAQEIQLGRENDEVIQSQMGSYDDAALQKYVSDLGHKLAAISERPGLDWNFRVVDDPVINAFALPGGYIYITRGILAHLESEAELASVMGHEIGHVTARHSVSQMSKAQLAQFGLGLGSILAPTRTQQLGGLIESGLGLAFLKFGRDDERQADDLGLRYIVRAGYDARPMAGVYDMLARVSAGEGGAVPSWMSTHPAPENRMSRIEAQLAALGRDFSGLPVGREEFLRRIDGIEFGEDPRQGYFKGGVFYHPGMRFRMDFPDGWRTENMQQAVVGIGGDQAAIVQLTLASEATAQAALGKFFAEQGVTRTGPAMGSIGGFPTAGDGFTATIQAGAIRGRVGYVEYGGRVLQLLGYALQERWAEYEPAIRASLASFTELTDPAALQVEPQRLKVVALSTPTTLEEFARRHGSTVPLDRLALINRVDPGARLEAGRSYKVITGGAAP